MRNDRLSLADAASPPPALQRQILPCDASLLSISVLYQCSKGRSGFPSIKQIVRLVRNVYPRWPLLQRLCCCGGRDKSLLQLRDSEQLMMASERSSLSEPVEIIYSHGDGLELKRQLDTVTEEAGGQDTATIPTVPLQSPHDLVQAAQDQLAETLSHSLHRVAFVSWLYRFVGSADLDIALAQFLVCAERDDVGYVRLLKLNQEAISIDTHKPATLGDCLRITHHFCEEQATLKCSRKVILGRIFERLICEFLGSRMVAHHRRVSNYELDRPLGIGSAGLVILARQTSLKQSGSLSAIKIIRRTSLAAAAASDMEILGLIKCQACTTVIHLEAVLESTRFLFLVMSPCLGGSLCDLLERISPMPPQHCVAIFHVLLQTLDHCHRCGVCHRDVRLDNVLLQQDVDLKWLQASDKDDNDGLVSRWQEIIRLADFSHCGKFQEGWDFFSTRLVGSLQYLAPEQCESNSFDMFQNLRIDDAEQISIDGQCEPYSGVKLDVWASGILLYGLSVGKLPFEHCTTIYELFRDIKACDINFELLDVPHELKKLLATTLQADPESRPTPATILTLNFKQ